MFLFFFNYLKTACFIKIDWDYYGIMVCLKDCQCFTGLVLNSQAALGIMRFLYVFGLIISDWKNGMLTLKLCLISCVVIELYSFEVDKLT